MYTYTYIYIYIYICSFTYIYGHQRVHPDHRGKGITKHLSRACNAYLDSLPRRPERVRISTQVFNVSSVGLHEKLGFSPIACLGLYGCTLDVPSSNARALTPPPTALLTSMPAQWNPPPPPLEPGLDVVTARELWRRLSDKGGHGWEWNGRGTEDPVTPATGLPLLAFDWVVMDCSLENLLMCEANGARFACTCTDKGVASFSIANVNLRVKGTSFYMVCYTGNAAAAREPHDDAYVRAMHVALWARAAVANAANLFVVAYDRSSDARSRAVTGERASLVEALQQTNHFKDTADVYLGGQLIMQK